jgi:hypothetical protein
MNGQCIRCGAETEFRVGDTWICASCYEARSSCCPEFGPDDLTDQEEKRDVEPGSQTGKRPPSKNSNG